MQQKSYIIISVLLLIAFLSGCEKTGKAYFSDMPPLLYEPFDGTTIAEVETKAATPSIDSSLVLHLPFDEGAGNGIIYGATTTILNNNFNDGDYGGWTAEEGTFIAANNYLESTTWETDAAIRKDFSISGLSSTTFSWEWKHKVMAPDRNWNYPSMDGWVVYDSATGYGYAMYRQDIGDWKWEFGIKKRNGNGETKLISYVVSGSIDYWYSMKATRDQNGVWEFFLDGVSRGTATDDEFLSSDMLRFWFHTGRGNQMIDDINVNANGGTWVDGVAGKALSFDGVDDYVDTTNPINIEDNQLTLEAWVNPNLIDENHIISKWDWNGGRSSYALVASTRPYGTRLIIYTDQGVFEHTDGINLPTGQWSHLVGTYDGSYIRLYINGVEVSNKPASGSILTNPIPVYTGAMYGSANFNFNGLIDEVRIYNRALSADEVKQQYLTGQNLISNSGFEDGNGGYATSWIQTPEAVRATDKAHSGSYSMKVITPTYQQATVQQNIPVSPNTQYILSGWVYNNLFGETNAVLDLNDIPEECQASATRGYNNWEYVSCAFTTGSSRTSVEARLVTDGTEIGSNTGSAWFDDVSLSAGASGITYVEGKQGQAVLVDDGDVLKYPTANYFSKDKGTIEFWMKPNWDGIDTQIGRQYRLFDEGANALHSHNHLSIGKYYGGGCNCNYLFFVVDDAGWSESTAWTAPSQHELNTADDSSFLNNWVAGQWHHMAVSWDNTAGMQLYVDGKLVRSNTDKWARDAIGDYFYLGSSLGTGQFANAAFDEFKVYDYVRTAEQIAADAGITILPETKPATNIDELKQLMETITVTAAIKTSLASKLSAAEQALEQGNKEAAINQLNALINQINAQSGKKITTGDADLLLQSVNLVMTTLTASPFYIRDILSMSSDNIGENTGDIMAFQYESDHYLGSLDKDNNFIDTEEMIEESFPLVILVPNGISTGEQIVTMNTDAGLIDIYLPVLSVPWNSPAMGLSLYVANDGSTYYADKNHDGTRGFMSPEEALVPEHLARKSEVLTCSDGTPYGRCSVTKPKYCDNGNLIDNCNICGCSSGQTCSNGQCIAQPPCTNECPTLGTKECLGNDYKVCGNYDDDLCLEWSTVRACPSGYRCSNGQCVETRYPPEIRVCYNCELPVPVFKVCPKTNPDCQPTTESIVELYLDNAQLLTFVIFPRLFISRDGQYFTQEDYILSLVDSKGVVTQQGTIEGFIKYKFNGANKFKILQDVFKVGQDPLVINFFYIEDYLYPPNSLRFDYDMQEKTTDFGLVQLYKKEGVIIDSNAIFTKVEEITTKIDQVTGKNHVNYKVYIVPDPFLKLWGNSGESYYIGYGGLVVGYGNNDVIGEVEREASHEYGHAIEYERGPFLSSISTATISGNSVCIAEGLTDALSIHLGYNDPSKITSVGQPGEGCPKSLMNVNNMPHDVGRCIFKYVYNDGIFADVFFRGIFNPNYNYDFDSCDVSIRNTCDSYIVWFSEAAKKDLTTTFKNEIKGDCSGSLKEAKQNLGLPVQTCSDGTLYGICSNTKPKYCDNGNLVDNCDICGCSAGQTCSNGQCVIPCTDDCSPEGAKQCSGDGYQTCGNYDADSCLEWSNIINCNPDYQLCSNGACVNQPCVDSDSSGGWSSSLTIKGKACIGTICREDYCAGRNNGPITNEGNWVIEAYCDRENIASKYNICPSQTKCKGGVCAPMVCSDGTEYSRCSTTKPQFCDNGNLINKCNTCSCPSGQICQSDGSCKSFICTIGDANLDVQINILDVQLLTAIYLETVPMPSTPMCCLDTNKDGSITPGDALNVQNYILGVSGTGYVGQDCAG